MTTIVVPLASLPAAQTPYELHRGYVLGVLGRRCGWLDEDDREAAFHDAYALLLEKERDGELEPDDMHPHQVRAYLVQTAIYKALDEGKRAERNRTEPLGEGALEAADPDVAPEELAAASLDNARLREIVAELPERRQTIVKLRFFFDRTPQEIQGYLGITERAYRRELERAMRYLSERYELVAEGRFCDSRRSLILAYVAGIAGPNRARDARDHLATCPGCSAWAAELREATRGAAALLPLPPSVSESGLLGRVGDLLAGLREGLADSATGLKQNTLALASRADPTSAGYATAARPGTVTAAIVGCLAVGGGTTYCAVEGVPDPVRSLLTAPRADADERQAPRRAAPDARPAPPPPASPAPSAPRQPRPAAPQRAAAARAARGRESARPRTAPQPLASPEAVDQEFGFESGASPPTEPAPVAPQPVAPAPRPPAQPPGEFDP